MLAEAGGPAETYVPIADSGYSSAAAPVKAMAFYLPQYHPIPENDAWWGRGFTEWTNVSKSVPQFVGHYQPRLPGELGFYDLRVPEVQRRQVELARMYGIHGFYFYYYWFHGRRLLERPLENFLADPGIDFPVYLCWANENWTRRWDGRDQEVLIGQDHSKDSDFAFIRDVERILRHPNYLRIHGRPLLIVYRAQILPGPAATAERWKTYCRAAGIGEPYLVAAQTFGFADPREVGFDAAVEFPPHNCPAPQIHDALTFLNEGYDGRVFHYRDVAQSMTGPKNEPYPVFGTVCLGWDNEARTPGCGQVDAFSTPAEYRNWLVEIGRRAIRNPDPESRLVFINAWNEWAEGTHLEPDRRFGYAYLEATANALRSLSEGAA